MTTSTKKRRPLEEVRAELLQSQETKELAQKLGLSIDDYVAKVLEYYADPDKQPMLYVAPEEQLRAAGLEATSTKEAMEWLGKVESGEIDLRPGHMKDGYKVPEKAKVAGIGESLTQSGSSIPAPDVEPAEGSSALRDQVKQQLRGEKKS